MLVHILNPAQNEYSCSIIQTMGSCTNFCHYCILFQKFLSSMNLNKNPCLGTISLLFHVPIMFEWDCVWDRKVWYGISCFQPFILCLSAGLKNFSKYREDFFWRNSFVIKGNIWVDEWDRNWDQKLSFKFYLISLECLERYLISVIIYILHLKVIALFLSGGKEM